MRMFEAIVGRRALVLLTLVAIAACAGAAPHGAMVEGAPNAQPLEGTVAVRTTLTGKACDDRERCAQIEAMRSVLFMGVPESPASKPMVLDEAAAMKAHRAYFDDLFAKSGYAKFIVRSTPGTEANAFTVVINLRALRTSLESAGVVRAFGY